MCSRVFGVALQKALSKLKDDLEAEKRDLVRTLERTSREVEAQSGKGASFIKSLNNTL